MEKNNRYEEVLTYLYDQLPMFQRIGASAYKADLNNSHAIDAHLGYPHHKFKTIHVAGTNGKGSVSNLLASILMEAGYKTGLYTSPHLRDFRERIRVNGQMIEKEYVVSFVDAHRDFINQLSPSFFELTMGMCFDYFAHQQVDVAVIEVGLGGRLDSTNIITPDVSVITNIGMDHMAILGNSIASIAGEKAGIIKPNIPVVIGEVLPETEPVFRSKAQPDQLHFAQQSYHVALSTQTADFNQNMQVDAFRGDGYPNLETPLLGLYQQKNAATVLTVVDQLIEVGYRICRDAVYRGFLNVITNTGFAGRWQILGNNPLMICDTGHNEDGIKQVVAQLKTTPYKKLHMVIGMVNDKDVTTVLDLLPQDAVYYFTRAAIARSMDEKILAAMGEKAGLAGKSYPTVATAIAQAKKNAGINDLIFIGGSTFVVAEVV